MPGRRVLVVDDDAVIREVAKVALELVGGWQVSTAVSGPEAHLAARAEHPDVVLLDVMMPGVDGPSTAATLRDDPETGDIPVIFLTAKAATSATTGDASDNLAGVIVKPFDPMRLAAEITTILGWAD